MQYGELRHPQVAEHTRKVAVLPIGSLEQHGHHLPLLTDSMINAEIVRRAEAILGDEALFLPVLWVGASDHHRRFPGTVSLSNETYTQMLVEMIESLIGSGFRRILLLNSHGGNVGPGGAALYRVQIARRDERDLWLALGSWFTVAAEQIAGIDMLEQKHVTHACELETSMILRLRPELVRLDLARGANFDIGSAFYCPDSSRGSRVSVARPFEHITRTGALGHPELSTAEKGEALFAVVVNEIVALVREMARWQTFEPG